jgi:hypothetical protein
MAGLLLTGTAHRSRDVRFIFAHGGEALPYLTERLTAWDGVDHGLRDSSFLPAFVKPKTPELWGACLRSDCPLCASSDSNSRPSPNLPGSGGRSEQITLSIIKPAFHERDEAPPAQQATLSYNEACLCG